MIPGCCIATEPAHTQAIVTLTVKNTGAKRTAYRIMTSAPHRFSVRPVFGLLKSHGIASILIQYRPADHSAICPDYKFRIKAAPVDNDQYSANDPSNFWNNIPPDQILITTIRCTFPQSVHHAFSAKKMPLATVAILPLEESSTAKLEICPSGRDHAPDTFHQNYRRALEDIVLLREENVRLREDLHRVRRSLARLHIASGDPVFNAFRNILPGSATAVIFFPYTLWQQLVTWFTSLRLGAFTVLVLFFCAGILTGSVLYK
ncbi:vesicle-associated membrane protein/synaptobrevin-binding protein-like isoform X2 [Paramacrobiotus metropolitanus]|uniref:vesicle-associated membrane protein/synaptobrevin-binding protein-like isoform X2 n=1 Tax=Paramacrobiotus metropolitanus TaxID=2943436 RepID=UPI002445A935|nr:vesicle-associated membrane protein/synaptobrevin-binding protein-like isoform X2 [Paramacrobiotus metropolitanus]